MLRNVTNGFRMTELSLNEILFVGIADDQIYCFKFMGFHAVVEHTGIFGVSSIVGWGD